VSKASIEVITSVQRRRHWSTAEKERLVAASLEPGAGVSAVARAAGIHPSQLYGWRREQRCGRAQIPAAFNAVAVVPDPGTTTPGVPERTGVIEIEFAAGGRMRITGPVEASMVSALIRVLTKGKRRR
jgi:transposase